MATATFSADPGPLQTLTTWRAHAVGIDNALIAVGWLRTSDTGQVTSPAAIGSVPAASSSSGYMVYKSPDSLGVTYPIYLRVDLYTAAGTAFKPAFRFQFASGTDGAGNVTGAFGSYRVATPSTTTAVTAASVDSFVSAGEGYLAIALYVGTVTGNTGGFIIMERSRDELTALAPITGNVVFITSGFADMTGYDYPTKTASNHNYCLTYPPYMQSTSPASGNSPVFPLPSAFVPSVPPWQPRSFLAVAASVKPVGAFTVPDAAGVNRTYLAPAFITAGSSLVWNQSAGVAQSSAMRYE